MLRKYFLYNLNIVQQECIPMALMGVDVLCQAKSGMGKTAVFVLSVLNRIDKDADPISALILCHTRELAYQIEKEFKRFNKYLTGTKTAVIYGGSSISEQEKMLSKDPP